MADDIPSATLLHIADLIDKYLHHNEIAERAKQQAIRLNQQAIAKQAGLTSSFCRAR